MNALFSLNKATLIGNVGKEPSFHDYNDGEKRLCRFSLATNESWKNKSSGAWEDETTWHNVVVFNKFIVDTIERHVNKGTKVYIEGAIKTRKYRKEGAAEDSYITEIMLGHFDGDIKILQKDADVPASATQSTEPFDDDIDF